MPRKAKKKIIAGPDGLASFYSRLGPKVIQEFTDEYSARDIKKKAATADALRLWVRVQRGEVTITEAAAA